MFDAILWDYDGTLADTAAKNRAVTVEVLRRVDPALLSPLPTALAGTEAYREFSRRYRNWTELYADNYRMSPEQIRRAAPLWAPCQEQDEILPPLFGGVLELLETLRDIPMAICSQNAAASMRAVLSACGAERYFGAVAGFDTLELRRQKPEPDSFLHCLEILGLPGGTFLYVGDQADDVRFAKAAERVLRERGADASVVTAAAEWSGARPDEWPMQPELRAKTPAMLAELLMGEKPI